MSPKRLTAEELAARVAAIPEPQLRAKKPPAARWDKPHTTVYISKRAMKEIKQIALDQDKKPHDLLVEGVELMLARYGRPPLAQLQDE